MVEVIYSKCYFKVKTMPKIHFQNKLFPEYIKVTFKNCYFTCSILLVQFWGSHWPVPLIKPHGELIPTQKPFVNPKASGF